MIAEEAGAVRRSLPTCRNLPRTTFLTGGRLVRSLPRQHAMQGQFQYAARAAHRASDLNPVRIFHRVLLKTGFAQEASVRS